MVLIGYGHCQFLLVQISPQDLCCSIGDENPLKKKHLSKLKLSNFSKKTVKSIHKIMKKRTLILAQICTDMERKASK